MQTFMFANYEGYMIWFLLQRDYEPMRIYIYHPSSIHHDKEFKITTISRSQLYKILGSAIIQGTLSVLQSSIEYKTVGREQCGMKL